MAAFVQRTAMSVTDARQGPDSYGMRSVLAKSDVLAAVSVPVELEGGPIGTLDIYSAKPREWDTSEVSALQAYGAIVASLLGRRSPPTPRGGWPNSSRRPWSIAP